MSGSTLFKTLLHICGLIAEGYVRSTASTQNQAMLVHCKNNKICQTSIDSHDVKFQCLHKICKTHIFGYFFFLLILETHRHSQKVLIKHINVYLTFVFLPR